jgi:hypothetical protein
VQLIEDCQACQAPRPAGRVCPHCEASPPPRSLHVILLGLLLGGACCKMPVVLYGIAPCDPETPASDGFACTCEDGGSFDFCSEQCDPATFTGFNPGFGCRCNSDGLCEEYALDGGG